MPFLSSDIDRAIVLVQYHLRGYEHLGFRFKRAEVPKLNAYLPAHLIALAAGLGSSNESIADFTRRQKNEFGNRLIHCQQFALACNNAQREAIRLIIEEILRQDQEMKRDEEKADSPYLFPLNEDNQWGEVVLALTKAFDVDVNEVALVPSL